MARHGGGTGKEIFDIDRLSDPKDPNWEREWAKVVPLAAEYLAAQARHRVRNESEIESVVYETIALAAENVGGFSRRSTLLTWMSRIMRNVIDSFESSKANAAAVAPKVKAQMEAAEREQRSILEDLASRDEVELAMSVLSAQERQFLHLYREGHKHRELAGVFGYSEQYSAVKLHIILKKMRAVLERGGTERGGAR